MTTMTIHEPTDPGRDGEAVRDIDERGRRRFLKTLAASALSVFAVGGTLRADSGPGGGGGGDDGGGGGGGGGGRGGGGGGGGNPPPVTAGPWVGTWGATIIPPAGSVIPGPIPTLLILDATGGFTWQQLTPGAPTGDVLEISGSYSIVPAANFGLDPAGTGATVLILSPPLRHKGEGGVQAALEGFFTMPGPDEIDIEIISTFGIFRPGSGFIQFTRE